MIYPLHFFGPGALLNGSGQSIAVRSRKQLGLLVFLASEYQAAHRRETLLALFWPNDTTRDAQNNLRVTLSRLRELADSIGAPSTAPLLIADRTSVQLHPAWIERSDSNSFILLLEKTRQHTHVARSQCAHCQAHLRAAVQLVQADFLAGFALDDCSAFEEWLLIQRERLHLLALEAYSDLAIFAENNSNLNAASGYAQRQIEIDPLRELAYRQQMRIFAKQGDRNAALTSFERCRTILRQELGLDPEAETLALHLQLVQDEVAPRPSLGADHLPSDPPVATPRRSNLPLQLTPFIGRQHELTQLHARLLNPTYRLLSIVGPGGIGKSRLAQQVAMQQLSAFADGVYFVPFAQVPTSGFIPAAIAESIGLSFVASPQSPAEQLRAMIGGKHLLLVLDNFEHLIDCAGLLLDLLRHSPNLVLLITSRERLNLQSEDLFELQGLPTPESANQAANHDFDAVRLFVDRAQRLDKRFQPNAEQLPQIVRICQLVEGFPLAIELAATWLGDLTCTEIVAELTAGLDRLETTQRDIDPQHRSLRAVFDSSWRLLTEAERRILAQLAVFRGGFTVDAARAVANATPALLSGLRNKSLLRHAGSRRYDMHALVQQFSAEALASDPQRAAPVNNTHRQYFLALLAEQAIALDTNAARLAVDKIQPDWENVAAAWQTASVHAELDRLQKALDGLVRFCNLRGLFQEAQLLLERAITQLESAPPTAQHDPQSLYLRCRLLTALAYFAGRRGLDHTWQLTEQALALAKQLDNPPEIAQVIISNYIIQASAFELAADFTRATLFAQRALTLAQSAGFELQAGLCFDVLGIVALETGQFERAQEFFQQVLALHERTGRLEQRSRAAIGFLGSVATEQGRYDVALSYGQRYLASCEAMGDRRNTAHAQQSLGYLWLRLGFYEKTIASDTQSAAQASAIGDREIESLALHGKAWAHRHLGQLTEALVCANKAVVLARALKAPLALAYALGQLAEAQMTTAQNQADWADSEANFQEAGAIFRSLGKEIMAYEVAIGLAELARRRHDLTTALRLITPIVPQLPTLSADGWDEPISAYVVCVGILHANHDTAAATLLAQGLGLLDCLAQKISDHTLRRNFLAMIPAHRDLYALQLEKPDL